MPIVPGAPGLASHQVKYENGMYNTHKEQGNHQYKTLSELVEHHKQGNHGFQAKLTIPAKRV
jgi:hypothetical protein